MAEFENGSFIDDEDEIDLGFDEDDVSDEDDFSDEDDNDFDDEDSDAWDEDETTDDSDVVGFTNTASVSNKLASTVQSLYSVYGGSAKPQFGAGYDWDMLFAELLRLSGVKLESDTVVEWAQATQRFLSNTFSDLSKEANVLSQLGSSEACRVCTEHFQIYGKGNLNDAYVAKLRAGLIKNYLNKNGITAENSCESYEEAYNLVNGHKSAEKSNEVSINYDELVDAIIDLDQVESMVEQIAVFLATYYDQLVNSVDGFITFLRYDEHRADAFDFSDNTITSRTLKAQLCTLRAPLQVLKFKHSSSEKVSVDLLTGDVNYRPAWHLSNIKNGVIKPGVLCGRILKDIKAVLKAKLEADTSSAKLLLNAAKNIPDWNKQTVSKTWLTNFYISCQNMLVLRQEPATSGVIWFDVHYDMLNNTGRVVTDAPATALAHVSAFFKGTYTDTGSRESSTASWGSDIQELYSGSEMSGLKSLYSFVAVTNPLIYAGSPMFASKPIRKLKDAGVTFDVSNILVGKTLANKNFYLSLVGTNATNLFATSRSGKGVMTLAMLAAALSGGSSVIYADNKPDMAPVLWNMELEFNKQSGKNNRLLAVDFSDTPFPDTLAQGKASKNWYALQGFAKDANIPPSFARMSERFRNKDGVNSTKDEFCDLFDTIVSSLTSNRLGTFRSIKSILSEKLDPRESTFGALSYLKFAYLAYVYKTTASSDTAPLVIVLDEVNEIFKGLSAWKDIVVQFYSMKLCTAKPDFKKLDEGIQSKVRECIGKLESIFSMWFTTNVYSTQSLKSPASIFRGTGAAPGEGAVSSLANSILSNAAALGSEVPVSFLVVGQRSNEYNTLLSVGNDATNPVVPCTLLKPLLTVKAQYLQGNWDTTEGDDIKPFLGSNDVKNAISDKCQYLHAGKKGISGFWAYKKGDDPNVSVFKSYLILNKNDFSYAQGKINETAYPYTHQTLSRAGTCQKNDGSSSFDEICGNSTANPVQFDALANLFEDTQTFKADAKRTGDFPKTAYKLDEAIGFDGLIQLLDTSGRLMDNAEATYQALFAIIKAHDTAGVYTSIEDYLFDYSEYGLTLSLHTAPEQQSTKSNSGSSSGNEGEFIDVDYGEDGASFEPSGEPFGSSAFDNFAQPGNTFTNPAPQAGQPGSFGYQDSSFEEPPTYSSSQAGQSAPQPTYNFAQESQPTSQPEYSAPQSGSFGSQPGYSAPQPDNAFNPPTPRQDPNQSVSSCTNFGAAYTEPINVGSPTENPFACFHKQGKYSNLRIRQALTDYLMKEIRRAFGGYDGITTFEEQNGVLIFNNTPFTPQLDESIIVLAPLVMQADLRRGAYASGFCFKSLTTFKRLQSITLNTNTTTDLFFYDNNIKTDPDLAARRAKKLWKSLRVLRVYGEDLLAVTDTRSEQNAEVKSHRIGASIGAFFATAAGIEVSSADRHPVATQLGKSSLARAAKAGVTIGGITWGLSMLLAISNPFLIIGGAVTAAAFVKNKWAENHINRNK